MNIFDKLQQYSTEEKGHILSFLEAKNNIAKLKNHIKWLKKVLPNFGMLTSSTVLQTSTVVQMIYLQSHQGIFHCPLFSTEIGQPQISLEIMKPAMRAITLNFH